MSGLSRNQRFLLKAAMLCAMRRSLIILVSLCCASAAIGQTTWPIPKLRELDQSNAIAKGAVRLSVEESRLIRHLTRRTISECVADPGPGDPTTAEGIFRRLRVARVHLTFGADFALVVQGTGTCMCGAVGNCPFWLVSEGSNPKILLKAEGIQTFSVQEDRASARFDLILGSHDSAMETYIQRFRSEGSEYRRAGCATIDWDDETGNQLTPPRITSSPCPTSRAER
jgi:hypothetical protein